MVPVWVFSIIRHLLTHGPNVLLLGALWSLFDGIWGVVKGSWGVLVASRLGFRTLAAWKPWESERNKLENCSGVWFTTTACD